MTYAQINKERAVPWWAICGAPRVGVPVVVAVLALVAPEQHTAGEGHDVDFAAEHMEIDSVSHILEAQVPVVRLPLANS
jgi:hypothetical protein